MKKAIVSVLAAVGLAGAGSSALAQSVTVPWQNSFETNTTGISILTNSEFGAWFGTADVVAFVTNLSYSTALQSPKVTYPIPGAHTRVVSFKDGTITNVLSAPGGNATVDVMLQPVRMEQPAMTAAISNSQMSVFVDTNGNLNVYHLQLTNDDSAAVAPGWTVLTGFPGGAIGTDKWVRLTVTMDYSDPNLTTRAFFQLRLNGYLFTNDLATADRNFARTGTWFICASPGNPEKINQVAFSGSGMFDDLVITNNFDLNAIQPMAPTITATAHGFGTISPSGAVVFAVSPADTNFLMAAQQYYHISQITTNGTMITGLTGSETNYNLSLTGITSDGSVDVYFSADMVNSRTPAYWLAGYGISIASDTNDSDSDGMLDWQEYVAGTIPVNSNSLLKLLSQQQSGTTNVIKWLSSASALSNYKVEGSTNLTSGWSTLGTVTKADGTNSYTDVSTLSPRFYRVTVTN